MSFCLCYDSPSNDLWIAERQWGMTDQQVIDGYGSIVFEGTEEACEKEYNKWRNNITYAVYARQGNGYYIMKIKDGDGSYQNNQRESHDRWVKSFNTLREAERFIAD